MAVIKFIKQPAKEIIEKGLDKIFKRVISGAKDSPYKNVDDTGTFPLFRNPDDLPGTEKKKLKQARPDVVRKMGYMKRGGRA